MVDRQHPSLSIVRQCWLLGISRSSLYYQPVSVSPQDLNLMRLLDQQYLATPFYGSRRMMVWLRRQGYAVGRKRVQRLMRAMGLQAIYRRPRTSQRQGIRSILTCCGGWKLTGLIRSGRRTLPTCPCSGGLCTLRLRSGQALVAIMDWHSRYVLAWRLSNTLESDFCVEALEAALKKGVPEIFNTDQSLP
jgi:putative transposase